MYKVLLADDEIHILDGLSRLIPWESMGLELAGRAQDGIKALRLLEELEPHIVITDIRMPGLNGLDLIERASARWPGISFVILSGYGEFDFANKAMQYGVRHYLLKPCDEEEVKEVLGEVIAELDQEKKSREFLGEMTRQMEEVLPYVKDSFFRDLVLTPFSNPESIASYKAMFSISDGPLNLLALVPDGKADYMESFSLKKLAEELLGEEGIALSTIIQDVAYVLVETRPMADLMEVVCRVKDFFYRYFQRTCSAAISQAAAFEGLRAMYAEVNACLNHRFYLEGDAIILKSDLPQQPAPLSGFQPDPKPLLSAMENGDVARAAEEVERYFDAMAAQNSPVSAFIAHSLELYMEIIRRDNPENVLRHMESVLPFQTAEQVSHIKRAIREAVGAITGRNREQINERRNSLVEEVIRCVEENIGDPKLSLAWIAGQILYMNSDYLGRLFRKETGERFSQYLLRRRMEFARKLIEEGPENFRVYEVSERVGFANNPQYFSQLFKRATGLTPKEYKRRIAGESP